MKNIPNVNVQVNWDDDTYTEHSEDLIKYIKKYLELDIISSSIFDDLMDIFLSGDLEKIKNIKYE